jgi:hypothetical protein
MTVVIVPGPASDGSPNGMMPISSRAAPSVSSSSVVFTRDRRACNMSQPMLKKMIPPAI